jgi:hypothetical protein
MYDPHSYPPTLRGSITGLSSSDRQYRWQHPPSSRGTLSSRLACRLSSRSPLSRWQVHTGRASIWFLLRSQLVRLGGSQPGTARSWLPVDVRGRGRAKGEKGGVSGKDSTSVCQGFIKPGLMDVMFVCYVYTCRLRACASVSWQGPHSTQHTARAPCVPRPASRQHLDNTNDQQCSPSAPPPDRLMVVSEGRAAGQLPSSAYTK